MPFVTEIVCGNESCGKRMPVAAQDMMPENWIALRHIVTRLGPPPELKPAHEAVGEVFCSWKCVFKYGRGYMAPDK